MFGDKKKPTRQATLRFIINTMMIKRTHVRDHMIHMIAIFNEMEILRNEIDGKIQIDIILRPY